MKYVLLLAALGLSACGNFQSPVIQSNDGATVTILGEPFQYGVGFQDRPEYRLAWKACGWDRQPVLVGFEKINWRTGKHTYRC